MPILSSSSDRLLQTLQLVAASPQPLSAKDMAQQLALPPSTLYRQLTHLSQWGLLQAGADGAYHAGPLGLQLAMGFQRHNTLAAQARPEMQRLARLSNETVALMVATRQQVICIEMMESQQALRCAFAAGKGQPLARGASALALLAFMPAAHSQATLDSMLPPQEHEALRQTLAEVRRQGYATSDSAIDAGIWGVSAPLLQGRRKLLGALTLMAPSGRAQRRAQLVEQTRQAARNISAYLGCD
ncbi:IclR family transcriptional regulator [Chromobacterium aquaticum]|uniref:IclR family transcriptional regulator n=1 Tax=Chromobacterium aquaticum TaxID=467180 RepID=A0ABV8ZUA1_9NEIS|nr:IclR family transcriptional regulator [Chromobacterium aquaticum]MCD5363523.1 IclR family transcriptional regulator [Chromobacterium aquaticum]